MSAGETQWDKDLTRQVTLVDSAVAQGEAPTEIARELIRLGEGYTRLELYSEAMAQLNRATGYLPETPRDSLRIRHLNALARVYAGMEYYDEARVLLEEALKTGDYDAATPGVELTYGLLGFCAEKKGKYLEALDYQNQSLALYRIRNDTLGESMVLEHIGSIYEDLGQYDLAFEHFMQAYAPLKGFRRSETANLLNNLGDVCRKQGRMEEALGWTRQALDLSIELGDLHQMESAHKDLSKIYGALGEYQKAYRHLGEANAYQEELISTHNSSRLQVLQTLYETNKKESEIKLLREQNMASTNQLRLLGVSSAALFALLLATIALWRKQRRSDRRMVVLQQKALTAELERKKTEEANLQRAIEIKSAALTRYSLNLSHKNKILMDLSRSLSQMASRPHLDFSAKIRSLAQEVEHTLSQDSDWDDFMHVFEEIHPDFMKKLNELAKESLSPSELRLGMLLRMNLSSKEIAAILRVTPDSVRVARYRLRKKLPIPPKKELVNFMVEL